MTENRKKEALKQAFVILEGQIFHLDREEISIGRALGNHLVIQHPAVSRTHAKLFFHGDQHVICDQESTSGTFVNGVRVQQQSLNSGDIILLANYPMVYVEYSANLQNITWESTRPLEEQQK